MWYNTPHWKIISLICCARRSPKVTLIAVFVSIVAWKQARWPPLFYYVFNISLSCNIIIPSFIGNLWWDLLLGITLSYLYPVLSGILLALSSLIFWLQAKKLRLSVCCNTFRNFNGSLNKRRMYPAQIITIEWTAETNGKRQTNLQTQARQPNKQIVESAGRRSLPK